MPSPSLPTPALPTPALPAVRPTAAPPGRRPRLELLSALARLVLAGVLGYASLTKIGDPAATVRAVRAYQLLPEGVVVPFAHALPAVELAVAVLLLLGLAIRLTAVVAAVLMGMFVIGIASAWARGLRIDCGCFGGGGVTDHPAYAGELLRDGALFLAAVGLAVLGRSAFALQPTSPTLPTPPVDPSKAELRRHRAEMGTALGKQREARLRRQWFQAATAGVLAVSVLVGTAAGAASQPAARAATPPGATAAGGVLVGSASAPHTLVLFEDPQCPVCGRFESTSGAALQQAVAAGQVRVDYRMRSFLGPESVRAVAALGAAQAAGRFEQLREQLYAHQPVEQTGGYTVDQLISLGAAAGLTSPTFVDDVRRQTYGSWARTVDDLASKANNVGTPELRLDGTTLPQAVVFDPAKLAAALAAPRQGQ